MEKKELSTEEKAMLLYEAMKPTLDFDGGEEWQNKINRCHSYNRVHRGRNKARLYLLVSGNLQDVRQNKRNENSDLITVRKILPHKQA